MRLHIITAIFLIYWKITILRNLAKFFIINNYEVLKMKDLQSKEFYKIIIMKNYICKFVRLNAKISEEDRYYYRKKDKPSLPTVLRNS